MSEASLLSTYITAFRRSLATPSGAASPNDALIPSAVSVLILPNDGIPHLVLTKRSVHVAHHKGQISFPGGTWEESDTSLLETALRETEEELGIPRTTVHVMGALNGTTTPTGFHITPFVGYLEGTIDFQPNPSEIEHVILVPLPFLYGAFSPRSQEPPRLEVIYHGHIIWGATARIIKELVATCPLPLL